MTGFHGENDLISRKKTRMTDNMSGIIFDKAYTRPGLLFGSNPTSILSNFLDAQPLTGTAMDVGCGDGRDTIPLLNRGFSVVAIDQSNEGIRKLLSRNDLSEEMKNRLEAITIDVLEYHWAKDQYDLIVGVTILDHLTENQINELAPKMVLSLKPHGILFLEVHTDKDPAVSHEGTVSEFSRAIKHYFSPNELLKLFIPSLRILRYEDRMEWDYDHGEPHKHGFASLVGQKTPTQ